MLGRPLVCLHQGVTSVNSHIFWLVWEPATWYCTFLFWTIDCCRNRVSDDHSQNLFVITCCLTVPPIATIAYAIGNQPIKDKDQYHVTVLHGPVSTHWCTCFLKLPADKLLVFNWLQAQLQVDFFAMVTSLLFEVNYKFINGSFAFNLALAKPIYCLKTWSFCWPT